MTRKPAVQLGILFLVAVDAEAHFEIPYRQSVLGLYGSMALLTGDFPFDMPLVIEKHMFGYVGDLAPRSRSLCIIIEVLLKDLWMKTDYVIMTIKALLHRRDSGVIGAGYIGMAELALDQFHPRVDPVAERNRLFRTQSEVRL
jgi:hypothetical protein